MDFGKEYGLMIIDNTAKSRDKKTRTLNAYEKYATLIFVSFAFRERYLLRRNKLRKFHQLEIGDKRFPPLDHGGVASAFLYFCRNRR